MVTTCTPKHLDDAYKKLLDELKKIDSSYLPVLKIEHSNGAAGHIAEFLDHCKDLGQYGVKAIVPIFLVIDDWGKWDMSFADCYPVAFYFDKKCFMQQIISENYLFRKNDEKSITNTIIKYLNGRSSGSQRKTLHICLNDEEGYDATPESEDKSFIICKIGNKQAKIIKDAVKVSDIGDATQFNRDDLAIGLKKGYADQDHWKVLASNDANINTAVDTVNSMANGKEDYGGVAVSIIHHVPFLDENHDILYFISNTVSDNSREDGSSSGKGIGGLFMLIDKRIIPLHTQEDNFLIFKDLWERLTEKLAVRIIHYYDYEQKQKNALKAAVGSIMARNMSHNIGSHVTPRTTVDLVYKRLTELNCQYDIKSKNDE